MGGRGGSRGGHGQGKGLGYGQRWRPPGGRGRRLGKEMGGMQPSGRALRRMPLAPSADTRPTPPALPGDARRNKSDAIEIPTESLNAVQKRSASLQGREKDSARRESPRRVAGIDMELCGGCGICASFCPENAFVFINRNPRIRPEKCTGCGLCIDRCPNGAIALMESQTAALRYQGKQSYRALEETNGQDI